MVGENSVVDAPISIRLAENICQFHDGLLTPSAVKLGTTAIVDAIGGTLAGAAEPCTQILLQTLCSAPGSGRVPVIGAGICTNALDAALINGTASHALDYDDFAYEMGGHHSVPVIAPVFSLAAERGLSGRDFLAAYLVGVETEVRLGRAVNFHHYDKGWHPTSTLGIFGATAAACRCIGLTRDQTAQALAIATSLASGIKANFATMTKPLHVGHCARSGLMAALLAERGFTANEQAFEHRQGFLNVYNGADTYAVERIFSFWAQPLEIEDPAVGLKQYACCGSTHPAIMMALRLVKEESVTPDAIQEIEILVSGRRLAHIDKAMPKSPLEAKFSVQYTVARALADGAVRLANFEGNAFADERVRRLLERTRVGVLHEIEGAAHKHFGAEVTLTLHDGRRLTRRIDNMVGRGAQNPMSEEEVWEKFSDCARRTLSTKTIRPLFDLLQRLPELPNLDGICELLSFTDAAVSYQPQARAAAQALK